MTNRLPAILVLIALCGNIAPLRAQTYNIYFGDIHSQSWYSDGNQDQNPSTYTVPVARAITYARDIANDMDFLGVSDHNHNESLNMTMAYWLAGNHEADSVNQDGVFVGMRGQEWGTISGGGHVLVYGTDKLFGWNPGVYQVYVPKSNYSLLFDSLKKYGGFAYFAHPQSSDYSGIFSNPYNASWDSVVTGLCIKNGPALDNNTVEGNPSSTSYESYYHNLLSKGYHVAPISNQDNHYTNFGMENQQRTVVLAPSLTRANVVDALRNMRVYATDDHNLQLRFEVGAHQMGEIFTNAGPIQFRIKVTDSDGSNLVSSIVLRYGIPGSGTAAAALTSVANVDSLVFSHSQPIGTTYYYYAYITETNGRHAWSAPMWITVPTGPVPQVFSQFAPSNASGNQAISGSLSWQTSANATQYDLYLGTSNPPTTLISADQVDTTYSYSGLINNAQYWWKVVAKNVNGTALASGAPWNFTTIVAAPTSFTHSAPDSGSINQPVTGTLSWQASGNAAHYDLYLDTNSTPTTLVSAGQIGTTYNYAGLLNSKNYYWRVAASNVADTIDATGVPWVFSTIGPSPGTFSLAFPPHSAPAQPLSGILRWNTSAVADNYDVYLDLNDPPLVRIDSNRIDTAYNYNGLLPGHTYHWKIVARNINGTTVAEGAPHDFSTVNVPAAASNVTPINITAGSLRLTWTDNATDETGYRVYRSLSNSGPFLQVGSDIGPDANSFNDSGLAINVRYYYRIVPFNGVGEGNFVEQSVATLAMSPAAPSISSVTYSTVTVTIDPLANPAQTEFSIKANLGSVEQYVQINGNAGTTPVWRTFAQWGGVLGMHVSGLHACGVYTFTILARNLDGLTSVAGGSIGQTLPCFTMSLQSLSGWNLLSLPVTVPDLYKNAVFPGSSSSAFFYQGSYQRNDTLRYGSGFWIKYGSVQSLALSGEPRTSDSIVVDAGWNIIGTLSQSIAIGSIMEEPSPIIVSRYYGYDAGYVASDSLQSMHGYWVKASSPGRLILSSSSQLPSVVGRHAVETVREDDISLIFEDNEHHRQELKIRTGEKNSVESSLDELPPIPPSGAFDVRFADGRSVAVVSEPNGLQVREMPILLQAVSYPVRVIGDAAFGKKFEISFNDGISTTRLSGSTPMLLHEPSDKLKLMIKNGGGENLPTTTMLYQNYPNPFNPSTEIRYDLSSPMYVKLTVVDLLGRTVGTLFEGEQEAGVHNVVWRPEVAAGVYYSKLEVVSHTESVPLLQLKKLVYIK